ncbi:MAG: hypothetical protein V4558_08915 [Gemmatimonadota bacterium]
MRHRALIGAALAITATAHPCAAQRALDFTRAPERTISTGVTSVSHGIQIADGRFVFADMTTPAIIVADFANDKLVTLGHKGAGPNEYRAPVGAVTDGAGGAVVPDMALGRALGVSAAGALTGTRFSSNDLNGAGLATVRGMNRDGTLFYAGRPPQGRPDSLLILRGLPASATPQTIGYWPMVPVTFGPPVTGADGRVSRSILGGSWANRTEWVSLPNETVAIVRPLPFRVDIFHPDGSRIIGQAVDFRPVLFDDKVKAAYREQRGPIPDGNFPAALPRFESGDDVIASDRNEVWVQRLRPPSDQVPVYDIFDGNARYTGTAKLRNASKVVGFGPGVVYVAREAAEDGFWYLERYRRP